MQALVVPLAGNSPRCDFREALTWPIGDLGLTRPLGEAGSLSCSDLSRAIDPTTAEGPPVVRYFLSGPRDETTGPSRAHIEIRPEEALRILFEAGWSDRLPRDLLELLSEELLGEEIPDPLDRDLRLFTKLTNRLQAMLLRRLALRETLLTSGWDDFEANRQEWESLEAETLQGLQIAYREARRLRLETDPTPLLSALMPLEDEGDAPSVERCLDALLALGLDAETRYPDRTLGKPTLGPSGAPSVSEEMATPTQDLVTLDQAAAMVHKSKRTLERYKTRGTLPAAIVEGGGGRADLFDWRTLGPWLTRTFGIRLPDRFPRERTREK